MMVKRKHVVCIDPKKKTLPKKMQSKAELVEEIASLKALNDALEDENKKYRETITKLEEKISSEKSHKYVDIVNSGCQTDDSDILLCEECEFPADTLYELGEHVGESHSGFRIPCNFCPDIYTSKEELEDHVTEVHNHFQGEHSKEHQDNRIFGCRFCEKYQPSGVGGTRSLLAMLHRLQNLKWPLGGPKMADGVWSTPRFLGVLSNFR